MSPLDKYTEEAASGVPFLTDAATGIVILDVTFQLASVKLY